jgi:transcriptional regulator with XRE-family HTH domain
MQLRQRRKELGLTQDDVAREAKISMQHYYLIENGKSQNITKETMINIAQALKATVTELFFPEESKEKVA